MYRMKLIPASAGWR